MNGKRYVERADIRRWKSRGMTFLGAGTVNAAMGIMIFKMEDVPARAKPLFRFLIGGAALLLFSIAFALGIRILIRYRRYTRYFKTTGLTRCTEDNVTRWLETRDVTR